MPFPLIPVLIGAASSGLSAYGKYKAAKANEPQKAMQQRAFKQRANTGYLKRYMADLRGRSADRARTELAMRPALRAIGAQQQQGQRQLAYQSAQQGLGGSGIEAQKQLALQQGTTQAVAGLGEKVLNQQLTQARQMQAQKEGQRMKLSGEIARQEGAVGEANRMAEFRAAEANRQSDYTYNQQMEQYDRNVGAAKTNILTSAVGGALSAGMPFATEAAGINTQVEATMNLLGSLQGGDETSTNYDPNLGLSGGAIEPKPVDYTDYAPGRQLSNQYHNPARNLKTGGYVYEDVSSAVPGIGIAEDELRKKRQTELETATTEFGTKKTAFETAEAERKKKIEDANLLAQQQFEESETKRTEEYEKGIPSLESETERIAKIKSGYEDFTTSEAERKKKEALQFGEETETYDVAEKERIAKIKSDYTDYETALKTAQDSPEFKMLEEKKNVLEKFNIGEEYYDKLRAGWENQDQMDSPLTAKEEELLKKYDPYGRSGESNKEKRRVLNFEINEAGKGDDSYSLPGYETFSDYLQATKEQGKMGSFLEVNKRKKKKLLKKYAKQQSKILPDEFKIKEELVSGEEPEYEFEPGEYKIKEELVAKEVPEYVEGEAPTPQEFVAGEFTEEAPKLQEITAKETEKIQREQIKIMYKAGIDVMGNIAKAKKNREATDFFKEFSSGNMTMDQMWSHPWATDNPKQIATMIANQQKTQRGQFAETNEKDILAQINAAGTDVNTLQMIQNSPGYNQLDAATQRTLSTKIDTKVKKAETKFKNLETTKRNITGHLFNLGQTTAEGTPITEDDPKTPEDESLIATSGESISSIIEDNPQGISPTQLEEILGHVDKIKQSVGDEPLDMSDYDSDDAIGSLSILLGINEKAGGSKEITKLLKELLKLPMTAPEVPLAEQIKKVDQGGDTQTQTGGFQFR